MRRRWPAIGVLSLAAAAACTAGGAVSPAAVAGPPASPSGPVTGTVLEPYGHPLPDQIVAIGDAKTTSDGEGRFSFASVPARYELVIASPDGAVATVYQGLSRRDPIISFDGARTSAPKHSAEVAVTLLGADPGLTWWQVRFMSARASGSMDGRKAWVVEGGKLNGPEALAVKWDGADTIAGVVMAHAMKVKNYEIPAAQFGQQAVSLRDGQKLAIELSVAKTPVARRPGTRIDMPKDDPGFDPLFIEDYRLPGGAGYGMKGPGAVPGTYEIPDLTGYGLELCGDGYQWNPYLHSRRIKCGAPPGTRTVLSLPRPPALNSPAWDTVATPGMAFGWTPIAGAVYALSLENNGASKPTAAHPHITIVTAGTTAVWRDLHPVGVAFPKPLAAYAATVTAHGPFATVDDLVGPKGLGDRTPRDRWRAESKELSIPVRPPLGKEEAACKFKETVMCGDGGGGPLGEFYRLSVLNRAIQTYPDFAAAVNIHCVTDCAGARAYLKAYAQYSATHPGFDSEQPLPVPNPADEPEPPPEMFEGKKRAYSGDE